ncbi:MAG: hypothetical protein JW793_00505 [Acidobacteria bacterium]|nr:hypothetical protein [Acidobacteriota bacterium]
MHRDPEFFEDRELNLVYMARRLKESLVVEGLLDAGGVDYAVEPAYYQSGLLFRSTKIGAYFYVLPEHEDRARAVLRQGGYTPYEIPPGC